MEDEGGVLDLLRGMKGQFTSGYLVARSLSRSSDITYSVAPPLAHPLKSGTGTLCSVNSAIRFDYDGVPP